MFTVSKQGDLSGVAKGLQTAVVKGQKDAGKAVAKEGRKLILDDVRQSRGSLRMMGGTLKVKTRTTASATSSVVELYGSPAGPWTIVTKGTKSYWIKSKRAQKLLSEGPAGPSYGTKVYRKPRRGHDYWGQAEPALDRGLFPVVADAVDAQMARA